MEVDAEDDEEDEEGVLGAFADGNLSVRTEAGVGVVIGELFGCATVFFSTVVFGEFFAGGGTDGLGAGGISRREGCSAGFDGAAAGAEDVEADDEESGSRLRIFGSAKIATIIRSTAPAGTT